MKTSFIMMTVLVLGSIPFAFAVSEEEKLEFAGELDETLGHFWALEQNLDENNSELALIHATHPIAELYDSMSEKLVDHPEFDAKLQDTLMNLQHKASTEVSREDAQKAIDEAKAIILEARMLIVGDDLSNDPAFKSQEVNTLLETAIDEYEAAIEDGVIEEMAEFQDGSAFVWRSEQIFNTMDNLDSETRDTINLQFANMWAAFDTRIDPSQMKTRAQELISSFEGIIGVESEQSEHMTETFDHMSPRQQINEGIAAEDITCKSDYELIFKASDNSPACVSSETASKLIARGWAI